MLIKNKDIRISNSDVDPTPPSISDKPASRHFVHGRTVGFFAVLAFLGSGTPIHAAQTAGAAAFKANCVMCHGPDGSGNTPIGKSMNVPDLRSAEIQKLPDTEIANVITNGKGNMPSFKNLSKDQIHSLIAYIREQASKK